MKKLSILAAIALSLHTYGNTINEAVQVVVGPTSGQYNIPDTTATRYVDFDVRVLRYSVPVSADSVTCMLSMDNLTPYDTVRVPLTDGKALVRTPVPHTPGFVRCKALYADADGKTYNGMAAVGVMTDKLLPLQTMPDDFADYWQGVLARAAKTPLDARLTPKPELSTNLYNVYSVSYNTGNGNGRMYGMLTVPKAPGKYPAVVHYPGAGVYAIGPAREFAEKGLITLSMGVNGIPVDMPDNVYAALSSGALKNYPAINNDNRDSYYYNRVVTGAVRAIDFVLSLPESNGIVGTYGGSQGGFLSIAVAALHPSVKALVANFPAMSDHSAYMHGRSGAWPHTLRNAAIADNANIVKTLQYYDTANFARLVHSPGCYAHGYNDLTCPPTAVAGVFNAIQAPKTIRVMPTAGHALFLEDRAATVDWIAEQLTR